MVKKEKKKLAIYMQQDSSWIWETTVEARAIGCTSRSGTCYTIGEHMRPDWNYMVGLSEKIRKQPSKAGATLYELFSVHRKPF